MPRSRRPLTFNLRDVSRLLRAYESAGAPQPTIRITKGGDIVAIPNSAPPATARNSWDEVLTDAEDAKRAS